MRTDIFDSINSKLTPDKSVITELLEKAERGLLPEEPVIETEQSSIEFISSEAESEEIVGTEAEPKAKVKNRFVSFAAVAAALVLVVGGGFLILRQTGIGTASSAKVSNADELDESKLREANFNAKLLFVTVNSSITDVIADGDEYIGEEYKNSDNYGKVISLNELTECWSGEIIDIYGAKYIDYSISSAFRDNGVENGYIYFELDDDSNVVAAQWSESTEEGIVGQYPEPETDPSAVHKIGQKFRADGYVDRIDTDYDPIWDPLSVSVIESTISSEGVTLQIERSSPLPEGLEQLVDYDIKLSWFDDSGTHTVTNESADSKSRAILPYEGSINYEFRWADFGVEPIVGTLYEIELNFVARTEGYEGGFHTGESDEYYSETGYGVQFTYFVDDQITVPNVVGLPKEEAEQILFETGFETVLRDVWDDDIEEGYIVKQQPEAGEKLSVGDKVIIFVSSGQVETSVKVPDVRDLTEEEAAELIKENKLTPVVEYIRHSDSTKGRVVVQSPVAGTMLDKNSEVKLQVSSGVGELPDNWGLTMRADYATSTGMSLYITSDGSAESYEVYTGTDFRLYRVSGDDIEELKTVIADFTWNALAQRISTGKNAETKIAVDWYKVYGELPKGTYRIEKTLWLNSGLSGELESREFKFGCVFTVE